MHLLVHVRYNRVRTLQPKVPPVSGTRRCRVLLSLPYKLLPKGRTLNSYLKPLFKGPTRVWKLGMLTRSAAQSELAGNKER